MKFLQNWTINLAKVPAYVEFNQEFSVPVDFKLADLILQSSDQRLTGEIKEEFRKLLACVNRKTGILKVKYSGRKGNLGRRYPSRPSEKLPDGRPDPAYGRYYSSLLNLPRLIKNTLFHSAGWRDYDQKKGHPTILLELARRNGLEVPGYEDYLAEGRFPEIVAEISDFYSSDPSNPVDKKDVKALFNKTIYGGGLKQWIVDIQTGGHGWEAKEIKNEVAILNGVSIPPVYEAFYRDTQNIIDLVYLHNPELAARVCNDLPDTKENRWSRRNKTMSYFCGVIENELTFEAYKYSCSAGLCRKREVDWGLDGLTIPPLGEFDENKHVSAMNAHVRAKTEFQMVEFIPKAFDPDEILWDCIEQRQALVEAIPTPSLVSVEGEAVDDDIPNVQGEQNEEYLAWKLKHELEWCKVKSTASFIRTYCSDGVFREYIIHNKKQIRDAYEHECFYRIVRGKPTKVSCVVEWFQDPTMRCYDKAEVLPPPLHCPSNVFNLWRPFIYEDNPINPLSFEFDREMVDLFETHLKIVCNHELKVYEYFSKWLAHYFQKPSEKPECGISLIGNQGDGKTTVIKAIGLASGAGKLLTTENPERDCWGNFNSAMTNAYLVVLNETDKRNLGPNGEKQLKALITDYADGGYMINQKGKDQFSINSFHRVIQATNFADPTATSKDDRRNLIVRCSDEKKGDKEYFDNLYAAFKRPQAIRSLYWHYRTMDISSWDFREIPRTAYHENIIEGSRNPIEIFMEYFVFQNVNEVSVDLFGSDLLLLFRQWKTDTGYPFADKISEGALIKKIMCELNLTEEAIEKLPRSSKGQKRRYHMSKLRERFGITEAVLADIQKMDASESA